MTADRAAAAYQLTERSGFVRVRARVTQVRLAETLGGRKAVAGTETPAQG